MGGFFEEARRHQAFMLRLDQEPEPFTAFTFTAQVEGGMALTFHAALVQTFPGDGSFEAAFQLTDWSEALDQQLETVPLNELRTLAKVGNSKEDLRRLALALVMKAHSSR